MTGNLNNNGRTILLVAAACAVFIVIVIVVLSVAGRSSVPAQEVAAMQQRVQALEAEINRLAVALEGMDALAREADGFQKFINETAKREAALMFRLSDIEARLGITPPKPAAESRQDAVSPHTPTQIGAEAKPESVTPSGPETVTTPAPVQKPAATAPPQPKSAVNAYYKVKPGDTIYSISRRFDLTVDQLKQINGLQTDDIYPGQSLVVTP